MDEIPTGDQLDLVGQIRAQTDTTIDRVTVLCLLADSIDMDEVKSKKADADTAVNYPSITPLARDTAERARGRLGAVIEFREALDDVDG